jgi:TPP-dependent indolepyruvate ferredoxin oxidoreductase alpha subunit
MKNVMTASDIGCYSLSLGKPYYADDAGICMESNTLLHWKELNLIGEDHEQY